MRNLKADKLVAPLVKLISNHADPVLADSDWGEAARGAELCRTCKTIDRSRYPHAVEIVVRAIPRGLHFGAVAQTGVHIFHRRFIDEIRPYLDGYVTGECRDAGGLTDFVTCYARNYLVLRGGANTTYPMCSLCGSVFWYLGRKPYVLARDLTNQRVYQDVQCFMILDEEVVRAVDWKQYRDHMLIPVGVRETPLDGRRLPGDPDWASWTAKGGG